MSFSYLAEKLRDASFTYDPFLHVQINDFFTPEHFAALTGAEELNLTANSDEQLFETLFANGYKIIDFPGCVTDKNEYIKWHKDKRTAHKTNSACEGFGITLRLTAAKTKIVQELNDYLTGDAFLDALSEKFSIDRSQTFADNGLQKYLDGYEISPHPDIRKKALTYMVNLNTGADAEARDHHTHYLQFRNEYKYVQTFWEGNPKKDRCWVPWDWCETQKVQRENNSIVIFSPNNQTIHGVKANYNHLANQRTQLYGNLWYRESLTDSHPQWEAYAIGGKDFNAASPDITFKKAVSKAIGKPVRGILKNFMVKEQDKNIIPNRLNGKD